MHEDRSPRAFVLMPFDAEFDAVYRDLIAPALEDAGYRVERADDFIHQQNVLKDIVRGIENADLIVADLTTANANVFYELGLAHGLSKPTVLLAQRDGAGVPNVPFDLRTYRITFYSTRFDEAVRLKAALTAAAEAHLSGKLQSGNPLTDFGVSLDPRMPERRAGKPGRRSDSVEVDELGALDRLEAFEQAMVTFNEAMERVTDATDGMAGDLSRSTRRMESLDANASAAARRRLISGAASDIVRFAQTIERELETFETSVAQATEHGLWIVRGGHVTEDEQEEAEDAATMLEQFATSADDSLTAVRAMLGAMDEWPDDLSVDLNRAKRRAARALTGLILHIENMQAFAQTALTLIREPQAVAPDEDDEPAPGS